MKAKQKQKSSTQDQPQAPRNARHSKPAISTQIMVIQKNIDTLQRSFTDPRDGTMDPDAAYEVFCLKAAITNLKTLLH